VSWSWDRCLAAIRRLSGATHGPLTVGSCTITPVNRPAVRHPRRRTSDRHAPVRDDAGMGAAGGTRGARAYTLARSLDRRHRYTEGATGTVALVVTDTRPMTLVVTAENLTDAQIVLSDPR